jgi:NDP-sugar pyrophosphorylase family protein
MGNGGGLFLSVNSLKTNQPFLVLNGDTLFKINLSNLLKHHSTYKADMTLSLASLADNSRYSEVLLDKSGKLIRSLKRRHKTSNNKVSNGGVYLL